MPIPHNHCRLQWRACCAVVAMTLAALLSGGCQSFNLSGSDDAGSPRKAARTPELPSKKAAAALAAKQSAKSKAAGQSAASAESSDALADDN